MRGDCNETIKKGYNGKITQPTCVGIAMKNRKISNRNPNTTHMRGDCNTNHAV